MSIESARAFYQKFTTDQALRTQLQSAASEKRTAIIQEAGYDFTQEEWDAVIAQVSEAVESGELDESQLEAVAGGVFIPPMSVAAYGMGLPGNLSWPFLDNQAT